MTYRRFLAAALVILALGGVLRTLWLRADPPTTSVGIVWHDEGAWTHNARNRALWGSWTMDRWNPVYIAPVFTALEYAAFRTWGVGTWQARTVPVVSGLLAIVAIMIGLASVSDRRGVPLVGGLLLATDYTWVMWNRAALMESTMTMFMVVAWAAYAMSSRRAWWGLVAGLATVLAWFTKASAAAFAAAIALDALFTLALCWVPAVRRWLAAEAPSDADRRTAIYTLTGAAIAGGAIVATFVWPHWTDYFFYNVQMSVERKPSYDLRSLIDRASWLPVTHDIFTRMWPLVASAVAAILGVCARLRRARPAERLLVLWVVIGLLELAIHDSGPARYYVMLIPAIVALAAMALASGAAWIPAPDAPKAGWAARIAVLPLVLGFGYILAGSAVGPALVDKAAPHPYSATVWLSAAVASVFAAILLFFWQRVVSWFTTHGLSSWAAALLVGAMVIWNLGQYGRWAMNRTDLNYQASVAVGRILPPGTLVHGKLANGLDFENQIKPIFVGRGFGNYDDRFDRDDARYILTYDLPTLGYESQRGLIAEILDRYPNRQPLATFDVQETPGPDRAVLIDKHPPGSAGPPGR